MELRHLRYFIAVAEAENVSRAPLVVYTRHEYPDYHVTLAKLFGNARRKLQIVEEHARQQTIRTPCLPWSAVPVHQGRGCAGVFHLSPSGSLSVMAATIPGFFSDLIFHQRGHLDAGT